MKHLDINLRLIKFLNFASISTVCLLFIFLHIEFSMNSQIKATSCPLFASSGSPLQRPFPTRSSFSLMPSPLAHGFGTNPKPFCRIFPIVRTHIYSDLFRRLLNLLRVTFKSILQPLYAKFQKTAPTTFISVKN